MQALARRVTGGAADHREESVKDGQESVRELHTSRPEEGCQPLKRASQRGRHGTVQSRWARWLATRSFLHRRNAVGLGPLSERQETEQEGERTILQWNRSVCLKLSLFCSNVIHSFICFLSQFTHFTLLSINMTIHAAAQYPEWC